MLDSTYASRRKEMKEKGIGGLSRLLKRVATAELIKKKRPRDSLNSLPRRSSIYKCFLSLLVSRLEKQPSPWLNGDGAVIDISHRIIAKFSKAHSLAGLNRCEQLFDNDPDAACCICRFQLVFPRCFQSHDALNPCGKGRPSNPLARRHCNRTPPMRKPLRFLFSPCACRRSIRPTSPFECAPSNVCSVINVRVSWHPNWMR